MRTFLSAVSTRAAGAVAVMVVAIITPSLAGAVTMPDALLEHVRAKHELPALAGAVVCNGEIAAAGAVGVRRVGSRERVSVEDKWHIGSCAKSMTAAIAGMLVQEGSWRWTTTLPAMFPGLAREIRSGWRTATLEELLAHYSGAGSIEDEAINVRLLANVRKSPTEQRRLFVRDYLTGYEPTVRPGAAWQYDNANYILVGHAIELALRQPWETIVRERLFQPLGLRSAGFGLPANGSAVDQPWGHVEDDARRLIPTRPDAPDVVNPAALRPAGEVHCSIGDLAKYARWQLRGARGGGGLLEAETFQKLHTPHRGDGTYACGWEVGYRDWAGGKALHHGGSNGNFMSAVWLAPEKNFAVVVCANLGGARAEAIVDETVSELIKRYLQER